MTSVFRGTVIVFVAVVVLAGSVMLLPAVGDVAALAQTAFDPAATVNLDRLVRYRVGVNVIRDYPPLGTGPGVLKFVYPKYALPGAKENWHLHNTYLSFLRSDARSGSARGF